MSEAPIIDIDNRIRLLGTAHVASASVAAVKHHIEEFQPDVIAVELCQSRHQALAEIGVLTKRDCSK
jgi:pheromone shutdown protein TraB